MKHHTRHWRTRGRSSADIATNQGVLVQACQALFATATSPVSGMGGGGGWGGGGLIVSEDVGEQGLEVASLVIDHYFLVGQRELLLFEMAARPIFGRAIKRTRLIVHMR